MLFGFHQSRLCFIPTTHVDQDSFLLLERERNALLHAQQQPHTRTATKRKASFPLDSGIIYHHHWAASAETKHFGIHHFLPLFLCVSDLVLAYLWINPSYPLYAHTSAQGLVAGTEQVFSTATKLFLFLTPLHAGPLIWVYPGTFSRFPLPSPSSFTDQTRGLCYVCGGWCGVGRRSASTSMHARARELGDLGF